MFHINQFEEVAFWFYGSWIGLIILAAIVEISLKIIRGRE